MKKKWLLIAGAVVLLSALTTAAFADKPIKLVVNGRTVETDVAPQLINNRVMVPVRLVAEAFGAKVRWEEEKNSVWIDTPELESLQRQVKLLHEAVAPAIPREAVEKWAKGVKERNGALQYAVLSPELKEQNLSGYESWGWVTGASSPWIEHYEIDKETMTGDGTWEYEVRFELADSTGTAGSAADKVAVRQYKADATLPSRHAEQNWYISQIYSDDSLTDQLKKRVEDLLAKQFELYRVLETEVSQLSHSITNSRVEAEFNIKVTHVLGCKTPAEWPVQKGRIKYLEENRKNLSPEKISEIEQKIDIWNKQLQEYIDNSTECHELLKITAELDGRGFIKDETVKIYSQDPLGDYQLVKEEDWFKSAEELINQGYTEMRELSNAISPGK